MSTKKTQQTQLQQRFEKALAGTYDIAVNGSAKTSLFSTSDTLAEEYLASPKPLRARADALVRNQALRAGGAGFVTGLGGALTLPITLPASFASALYIQLRMVAALARMGGHDPRSEHVRTYCYLCLIGRSATDIAKDVGIKVGKGLSLSAIKRVSGATLQRINRAVGLRLFTKFGQTGVINLHKVVPVAGGIVGAAFDGGSTLAVGKAATSLFIAA